VLFVISPKYLFHDDNFKIDKLKFTRLQKFNLNLIIPIFNI